MKLSTLLISVVLFAWLAGSSQAEQTKTKLSEVIDIVGDDAKAFGDAEITEEQKKILEKMKEKYSGITIKTGKATLIEITPWAREEKSIRIAMSGASRDITAELIKAYQEKDGIKPGPEPAKIDLSDKKKGRFATRSQGELGTCHAFANIPLVEAMENSPHIRRAQPYRVSANWLVFASVLDRLCNTLGEVRPAGGWSPAKDLDRLLTLGYCEEKFYIPYNKKNTLGDLSEKKKDDKKDDKKDNKPKSPASPEAEKEKLYSPEEVLAKIETMKFLKGEIKDEKIAKSFRAAFGISWSDAKDLLCKPSEENVKKILDGKVDVDPLVKTCLTEARTKADHKKNCRVVDKRYERNPKEKVDEKRIEAIKDQIKKDNPVFVAMWNYVPPEKVDEHEYHALAIIGYDNEKKHFLVQNSWGEADNKPIPYDRINDVDHLGYLVCDPNAAPRAKGAEGQPRSTKPEEESESGEDSDGLNH